MSRRSGVDDLERWAADARARDAAEGRVRQRWLRTQAEEEATLHGFLLGLAEQAAEVTLRSGAGRSYAGPVASVGRDFVALGGEGRPLILVALADVATVTPVPPSAWPLAGPEPGADDPDAGGTLGVGMADLLAQAVGHRAGVTVDTSGERVAGDLVAVGRDVLAVRTATRTVVVTLQSVSAVSLLDSG